MKLTLIAEGSTKWQRLMRRWGVSYLIGEDVLFDTFGAAKVFMANLSRMKINTSKIQHIVISHDHWDHLSGLWPFLEKHKSVTVYICPGSGKAIKEKLTATGAEVVEVHAPREIGDGIYTTGLVRGIYNNEAVEEQAIVVKTRQGLVLVTGCAHPGIINILDKVAKDFGQPVFWVMGGMHLKDSTASDIKIVVDELKRVGVERVSPMHCTGIAATGFIKESFGKNCILVQEGSSVDL